MNFTWPEIQAGDFVVCSALLRDSKHRVTSVTGDVAKIEPRYRAQDELPLDCLALTARRGFWRLVSR